MAFPVLLWVLLLILPTTLPASPENSPGESAATQAEASSPAPEAAAETGPRWSGQVRASTRLYRDPHTIEDSLMKPNPRVDLSVEAKKENAELYVKFRWEPAWQTQTSSTLFERMIDEAYVRGFLGSTILEAGYLKVVWGKGTMCSSGSVRRLLHRGKPKKLVSLSEALENIPNVSDVTSLTTTDYIEGTAEGIQVSPLIDPATFKGTGEEIEKLKEKLRSWIVYDQALVSRDYSAVQILVVLERKLTEKQREQVYHDTLRTLHQIVGDSLEYHVAGTPALSVLISENMRSDLRALIPIVLIVVILTLYVSFRRWAGVLLPMLSITIGTIWTLGIMALCNVTLSMGGETG